MKSFEEFKEEVSNRPQELKSVDIDMGFNEIACVELAEQKARLMNLMTNNGEDGNGILQGLLCLIDTIQAQLANYHGFDEKVVFPYDNYKSSKPEPINYKEALVTLLPEVPKEVLPILINKNPELRKVLNRFFKGDNI